jgi:S-DNA-T family DNA segregation ATPase FtsK/SpoIIIE
MKKNTPASPEFSLPREIAGVVLVALGLFVFVSLFWPLKTGAIGRILVGDVLQLFFGMGVHLLPYALVVLGVFFIMGRKISAVKLRTSGVAMLVLALVTLWDVIRWGLAKEWSLYGLHEGGGGVGRVLNYLLHWADIAGAYIILGAAALIGFMMASHFSLQKQLERASERVSARKEFPKNQSKEVESFKPFIDPKAEPEEELDEAVKPVRKKVAKKIDEPLSFIGELDHQRVTVPVDGYQLPPLSLLDKPIEEKKGERRSRDEDVQILETTLASFGVEAKVVDVCYGPAITRYELEPGSGVRISRIANLADDISLSLASTGVRIEAPVPGKSVVGVEIPNHEVRPVTLFEVANEPEFQTPRASLLCALGKDVAGKPIVFDLAKMPHLLIAGATGSGKSVCINSIITSILLRNRPDQVKFIMIDPKKVELSFYNDIPHLLAPVVTEAKLAAATLKNWAIKEMEERYDRFSQVGVKNIEGYNLYIEQVWADAEKAKESSDFVKLPYIVVIIDELADLMMVASRDVEGSIIRLAQLARATGIHLVVATQRPSVNVITGLIKANIPSRIAFAVSSQIDARTILDNAGAEKLLGRGDMLYSPVGVFKPFRLQGVYLSEKELNRVVDFVKRQAKPQYNEHLEQLEQEVAASEEALEDGKDPLYFEAKQILQDMAKPSVSMLQRRLRIGYNRAARVFEELQAAGEISRVVEV